MSGDVQKSRIPTPSAAEVAPILSKLLIKPTASINGKVSNSIETPQVIDFVMHLLNIRFKSVTSAFFIVTCAKFNCLKLIYL